MGQFHLCTSRRAGEKTRRAATAVATVVLVEEMAEVATVVMVVVMVALLAEMLASCVRPSYGEPGQQL